MSAIAFRYFAATVAVESEGAALLLELKANIDKPREHAELAVKLSPEDRAWLKGLCCDHRQDDVLLSLERTEPDVRERRAPSRV